MRLTDSTAAGITAPAVSKRKDAVSLSGNWGLRTVAKIAFVGLTLLSNVTTTLCSELQKTDDPSKTRHIKLANGAITADTTITDDMYEFKASVYLPNFVGYVFLGLVCLAGLRYIHNLTQGNH